MLPNKSRILFVDDEPKVLHGLRRTLHSMSDEWDMVFAESGAEALRLLDSALEPIEVIVADMRMPGMDGAELLQEVKKRYPQTIRIVLSGHENQEATIRMIGLTHQYLSKPCDVETLRSTLIQAYMLRDLLAADELKKLLAQMESLPSFPALYNELIQELGSTEASIKEIGRIISQDIGMTARMLQLVNSAYFGLRRHISDPTQAVMLLGLDTVRALVLSVHVFSQFDMTRLGQTWFDKLQQHSLAVGAFARQIAEAETAKRWAIDYAFTAGLLHDVGKLVLATRLPEKYETALALAASESFSMLEAERQVFGATHAEVGAYLLGLWGLPDPVVETLAYHHYPTKCFGKKFSPLTAVHVANSLAHEIYSGAEMDKSTEVDLAYLTELNLLERLPAWQVLCQKTLLKDK